MSTENMLLLKTAVAGPPYDETAFKDRLKALHILALAIIDEIETLEVSPLSEPQLHISDAVQRFEVALIRNALKQTGGRLRPTARLLDMKVTTLHDKLRRYRIDSKLYKL